eukprot:8458063-Pyramimonas_sp.AAC.1
MSVLRGRTLETASETAEEREAAALPLKRMAGHRAPQPLGMRTSDKYLAKIPTTEAGPPPRQTAGATH